LTLQGRFPKTRVNAARDARRALQDSGFRYANQDPGRTQPPPLRPEEPGKNGTRPVIPPNASVSRFIPGGC